MTALEKLKQSLAEKLKSGILPGDVEQLKMAPYNRVARNMARVVNDSPKLSAVLLLLYEREGEPYFVLTQRHAYKGVHSKQVSLPGGKKEDTDQSLVDTALRETREEIGVRESLVDVIGNLTDVYIPPSGFLVTPVIGFLESEPEFQTDPREVDYIIESPIARLLESDVIQETKIPIGISQIKVKTPYFSILDHIVWGATAMILSEFKALLDD
jgi:8-oxo-dGTP pyrophosphatase MutT (NUDIX family)